MIIAAKSSSPKTSFFWTTETQKSQPEGNIVSGVDNRL